MTLIFVIGTTMFRVAAHAYPPYVGDDDWGREVWIWGNRIWENKVDDEHTLVVDERGRKYGYRYPNGGETLGGLTYYWRLLKKGETDGPVLFSFCAVRRESGIDSQVDPIDVLCTDLIGDDLVVAFNYRRHCKAFVVHRNNDGTLEQKPEALVMLGSSPLNASMKTAHFTKLGNGTFRLTVKDDQGKSADFELRNMQIDKMPGVQNWSPVVAQKSHGFIIPIISIATGITLIILGRLTWRRSPKGDSHRSPKGGRK
jgi:hypothetical protein